MYVGPGPSRVPEEVPTPEIVNTSEEFVPLGICSFGR